MQSEKGTDFEWGWTLDVPPMVDPTSTTRPYSGTNNSSIVISVPPPSTLVGEAWAENNKWIWYLDSQSGQLSLDLSFEKKGQGLTVSLCSVHVELLSEADRRTVRFRQWIPVALSLVRGRNAKYEYRSVVDYRRHWTPVVRKMRVLFLFEIVQNPVSEIARNGGSLLTLPPFTPPLGGFAGCAKYSDVTLVVEGKEIPAHKMVLASASPFFAKMFESAMKEAVEGRVVLKESNVKTILLLLQWVYGGKGFQVGDMLGVLDLLKASDFYAVPSLEAWCIRKTLDGMSPENVVEVYKVGRLLDCDLMTRRAMTIIKSQKKAVFRSIEEFEGFCAMFPELKYELVMC